MKTNYILIDYENVQPKNIALLQGHEFKILVFVGANQSKLPFELVSALQTLGTQVEYIQMSGNGQNALDFHIAFYIGQIAARDPNSYFHIISKDKGFDPLIAHLKSKKILAQRETNLAEIPILSISNASSVDEKIEAIVKDLVRRGQSRPRKVKTLLNTINALFMKKLGETELTNLLEELKRRKLIVVNPPDSVSYKLPKTK